MLASCLLQAKQFLDEAGLCLITRTPYTYTKPYQASCSDALALGCPGHLSPLPHRHHWMPNWPTMLQQVIRPSQVCSAYPRALLQL